MSSYWFRKRTFGWGWIPISIEGWIMTGIFILSLFWVKNIYGIGTTFWAFLLGTLGLFSYIADKKTEKPVLWKN